MEAHIIPRAFARDIRGDGPNMQIQPDRRLGPYENKARDILFDASPLSELRAFQVLVERYESAKTNVEGFYTHPVRHRKNRSYNLYSFGVGGFRFVAKVDAKPFPKDLASYVLSGHGPFRGRIAKLEGNEMHSAIMEMFVADHSRRKDQYPRRV